jgi:hypothetical protein
MKRLAAIPVSIAAIFIILALMAPHFSRSW